MRSACADLLNLAETTTGEPGPGVRGVEVSLRFTAGGPGRRTAKPEKRKNRGCCFEGPRQRSGIRRFRFRRSRNYMRLFVGAPPKRFEGSSRGRKAVVM